MLASLLPEGIGWGAAGLLVAASLVTSAITGAFGIGGGVALLAVMSLAMPVKALIPVHGLVQFGSNAGRAVVQREHVVWAAFLPFLLGSAVGAALGAQFFVALPEAVLKTLLGLFILVLTYVPFPKLRSPGAVSYALAGTATTFLSMFMGATGPLNAAVFGQAFSSRLALIATHAATMTAQHLLKVSAFFAAGFALAEWLPLAAAMIASGLLGTLLGSALLARMDEKRFRAVFKAILTLLALDLLRRSLLPELF